MPGDHDAADYDSCVGAEMKAELRNAKTLIVTPETALQMEILRGLEGAVAQVEKPKPLEMNVESLKIEKKEPPQ